MITILIRTSYRPGLFIRALNSIYAQSYKNIRVIVSYDDDRALEYIPEGIKKIRVQKNGFQFGYDNYLNELKALVDSGWFFCMDDDDYLGDVNALKRISKYLTGSVGIVCQFSRSGRLKPSNEFIRAKRIIRSKIGTPCLFLHHSHKNVADFDGSVPAADYHWIKAVSRKVKLKFVPIVVVCADRRSGGSLGEN